MKQIFKHNNENIEKKWARFITHNIDLLRLEGIIRLVIVFGFLLSISLYFSATTNQQHDRNHTERFRIKLYKYVMREREREGEMRDNLFFLFRIQFY